MATFNSDIAQSQSDAETNFAKAVKDATALADHVAFAPCVITIDDTTASSDTIRLVKLPEGVRVVPHLSYVYSENPGTSLQFTVGDAADTDRYSTAIDVSAGGDFPFSNETTGPLAGYKVGDDTADDRWVSATVTAASGLTADQKVVVWLAYTSQ